MLYGHGIMDIAGESSTPFYVRWMAMLQRCYDTGALSRDRSYAGVTVCEEWLTFSNFKSWMETKDWKGKCLDKDLKGGNVYSPETCLFISGHLNRYWTMKRKGVSWEEDRQKWRVKIGRQFIGRYTTKDQARRAYELNKLRGLSYFLGKEDPEVEAVISSMLVS